jgi:hypothetical protein
MTMPRARGVLAMLAYPHFVPDLWAVGIAARAIVLVFRNANNVNIGHVHLREQCPWPIMRGRSN